MSTVTPPVPTPARKVKVPKYCHHKATGQAYVHLDGADHYLGKHGTPESFQKYATLIGEHSVGAIITHGQHATPTTGTTVAEVAAAYLKHAIRYYVKNGKVSSEVCCIKSAIRHLVALYADLPANDFGPIALKAVRQRMVDVKEKSVRGKAVPIQWTRRFINMSVGRIRRMFKWAVENELVEPTVLTKLQAVAPLLAGRTEAREHEPRHPIDLNVIEKVKALVPARTKDLIDLWLIMGARPGELVQLTGEMIDRTKYATKGVWVAELKDHKTAHRGKQRVLIFNLRCQEILLRYMNADPTKRLFAVNRASVSDGIKKACRELKIPVFTAHWLRHTYATRARAEGGLDVAQVTLGHANASMTELYASLDLNKAIEFARDAG